MEKLTKTILKNKTWDVSLCYKNSDIKGGKPYILISDGYQNSYMIKWSPEKSKKNYVHLNPGLLSIMKIYEEDKAEYNFNARNTIIIDSINYIKDICENSYFSPYNLKIHNNNEIIDISENMLTRSKFCEKIIIFLKPEIKINIIETYLNIYKYKLQKNCIKNFDNVFYLNEKEMILVQKSKISHNNLTIVSPVDDEIIVFPPPSFVFRDNNIFLLTLFITLLVIVFLITILMMRGSAK